MFRVSGDSVQRLCDDRAISLSDLKIELAGFSERVILAGDGAKISFKSLGDPPENILLAPANRVNQIASGVACAALRLIKEEKTTTSEALMPVYLRLPQAQRELNKRLGKDQADNK